MSARLLVVVVVLLAALLPGCKSAEDLTAQGAALVDLKRDFDGGKQLFLQALEKDEKCATAHKCLAYVLTKEGKLDEALKHLERAVELKPDFGNAHINLSLLYSQRKDWAKAVKHMDLAVDNGFPVDVQYRTFLEKHR